MNVLSIKSKNLLNVFVVLIILLSSCTTTNELNSVSTINMPVMHEVYTMPTVTLAEPIDNFGYIIPVASLRLMPNGSGIIVRTKNIDGHETFDAITVKVNKIIENFALVEANDYYKEIALNKGDLIIDKLSETLPYLNKVNHEWLKESFQRANKEKD